MLGESFCLTSSTICSGLDCHSVAEAASSSLLSIANTELRMHYRAPEKSTLVRLMGRKS
jgi:hypothetical protein